MKSTGRAWCPTIGLLIHRHLLSWKSWHRLLLTKRWKIGPRHAKRYLLGERRAHKRWWLSEHRLLSMLGHVLPCLLVLLWSLLLTGLRRLCSWLALLLLLLLPGRILDRLLHKNLLNWVHCALGLRTCMRTPLGGEPCTGDKVRLC